MFHISGIQSGHYRALIKLGLPIIIGQIGTIILGFADTLMIGHHTMPELAAASFVNSLFTVVFVFSLGFANGITPIVGSYYGRGEYQSIARILKNSVVTSVMMTLLLGVIMLVAYAFLGHMGQPAELLPLMRPYFLVQLASLPFQICFYTLKQFTDGMTRTQVAMWVVLLSNVLNIFGNYVLIYGKWGAPELGLLGAGISTLVSRIVMALLFVAIICKASYCEPLRRYLREVRLSRTDFRLLNRMGWPLALQVGMETAAFNLSAVIVGWIGVTALAANQITAITSQFCYFIISGMGAAISIRVSLFYGQKSRTGVVSSVRSGMHLVLMLQCFTAVTVWLLRNHLGGWFTDSVAVSQLVASTILPLLVYQFSDGVQNVYANALRGIAHVRWLAPIAFVSYFVVCLPVAYLLGITLEWGLVGIWWAYFFGLTLAAIMYVAVFRTGLRKAGLS